MLKGPRKVAEPKRALEEHAIPLMTFTTWRAASHHAKCISPASLFGRLQNEATSIPINYWAGRIFAPSPGNPGGFAGRGQFAAQWSRPAAAGVHPFRRGRPLWSRLQR